MNQIEQMLVKKTYMYEATVNKSTYIAENVGAGQIKVSVKMPRKRTFTHISNLRSDGDNEALNAKIVNVVKYHQLKLKYGRKSGDYSVLTAEQRAQFGITDRGGGLFVIPMSSMIAAERAVLDALEARGAAQ